MARAAASPVDTLRAAAWTWRSARRLAGRLDREGLAALEAMDPAPSLGQGDRAVVGAVLHRLGATCLVSSAVLQRWDADHHRPRPLVIGVTREGDAFTAHAWLEGERSGAGFTELHRRPPA